MQLKVNPLNLQLHINIQQALKDVFIELVERKDYESVLRLLEMKTFDVTLAYSSACTGFHMGDYQAIMEYFYLKRQKHKLALLLSPDCVMSMKKVIFRDASISHSLLDLPKSMLSLDSQISFNFRTNSMKNSFCKIVSHALNGRFTETNWDKIISSVRFQRVTDAITLSDSFSACDFSTKIQSQLFYYLNPTMLFDSSSSDDKNWLLNFVLPVYRHRPPLPEIRTNLKYIEPKVLLCWNEIIFRTISTLAFYFEICAISEALSLHRAAKIEHELLENGKRAGLNSLKDLNSRVLTLLQLDPICAPFKETLNILNQLYILFISKESVLNQQDINQLYKSIIRIFDRFSPASIQSDWMYNLFHLFWQLKSQELKMDVILSSLDIFFAYAPTVHVIHKTYFLFVNEFNGLIGAGEDPVSLSFESKIPEDRLLEIYKYFPHIIATRYESINFSIRFGLFLKNIRMKLGIYNYVYSDEGVVEYLSIPLIARETETDGTQIEIELIKVFESTVLSLHRTQIIGIIHPYAKFIKKGKDSIKPVDIRDCLKQFFELILMIKDFRIIIRNSFSTKDRRPVIVTTPLLSRDVSNILGQAMALSIILNVKVPFILDLRQSKVIFDRGVSSKTLENVLFDYCKRAIHLNILLKDKTLGISTLSQKLKGHFESFYKWNALFFDQNAQNPNELVSESFIACNSRILSGFNFYFEASKFSFEEIIEMIFKTSLS